MTTISSYCRKSLDELITEITADYWGHVTTEIVRVDEVLNKIDKVNANRELKDRVYIIFEVDRVHRGDPVGWSLKEINMWRKKILEYTICKPSRYALAVPDPQPCSLTDKVEQNFVFGAAVKAWQKFAQTWPPSEPGDSVNHPTHYVSGRFEVIDVIEDFCKGLEGRVAFDCGNAIKYILRWHNKNGVEDLKKAEWYIQDLIKHLESEEKKDETQNGN